MTRTILGSLILLTMALLVGMPSPARAAESYDNCTGFITSVPAQINTPGTWCLKKDLATAMTSGSAILIMTNNVTIDCNDFKVGGMAAGLGTMARGISARNQHNIVVRHCNVRGFFVGLELDYIVELGATGGGGHVIEDNRFEYNTSTGLWVEGDGSVVRRNRVFETGGATGPLLTIGIKASYSVDVLDNTVSGVSAAGSSIGTSGIFLSENDGGSVNGNRVRQLQQNTFAAAINSFGCHRVTLRDNVLIGNGDAGDVGMGGYDSNGIATNNVINGFATGIEDFTDSGGNVIAP